MTDKQRIFLVKAAVNASAVTMQKAASEDPNSATMEVLGHTWPSGEEQGQTKLASLARILATGSSIEQAEAGAYA